MTFDQLKTAYHTDPKPPLHLPDWEQPCDQCERETGTSIKVMRAGIGNACLECGRLRRGKPYLSKHEFQSLTPTAAKGERDEAKTL